MFTLTIKKNGIITNGPSEFPTREEAVSHFEKHKAMGTFGTPSRTEVQSFEVSPAVIAEDGTELAPAVIEEREVKISGDFEHFIEDLTAQAEQERINAEALAYLTETDYLIIRELDAGTPCPADIKQARAEARAKIVR